MPTVETNLGRATVAVRATFAMLLVVGLAACSVGAGANESPTDTGAAIPGTSAPSVDTPAGSPSVPEPTPEPSVARTPGPSVPRVAPLQPPAYASRVVVPAMDIDLPVISGDLQPPPSYPLCDVAAYVTQFQQPYDPGITYISAHAQEGMFLPLLRASERAEGAELLGMSVEVYVSDGRVFTYQINRVVRGAIDYSALAEVPLTEQSLVLQTSEGPYGTVEKLQVFAQLTSEAEVEPAQANPTPMPRDCEPDASAAPASPR